MERRTVLQGALAALGTLGGGFISGPLSRAFAQSPSSAQSIELGSAFIDQPVDVFQEETRQLVAMICETILPRTDTPGAIDAQVPKFIELIYADWMTEPERGRFDLGLKNVEERAQAASAASFGALSARAQRKLLEQIEDETDHPWFDPGGLALLGNGAESAPFIVMIKEMTVTGFFMSEIGARDVLKLSPMGEFDGDTRLAPGASSWAAKPLM